MSEASRVGTKEKERERDIKRVGVSERGRELCVAPHASQFPEGALSAKELPC